MQLVAYGMQDMYLTGNVQITFFKNLYRRHTNFSVHVCTVVYEGRGHGMDGRTRTQPWTRHSPPAPPHPRAAAREGTNEGKRHMPEAQGWDEEVPKGVPHASE